MAKIDDLTILLATIDKQGKAFDSVRKKLIKEQKAKNPPAKKAYKQWQG